MTKEFKVNLVFYTNKYSEEKINSILNEIEHYMNNVLCMNEKIYVSIKEIENEVRFT